MAIQNYSLKSMREFFNYRYCIPNYQREYSWEEDELYDFWQDLLETYKGTTGTHFFGQVVVQHDDKTDKRNIIDGQQRTITSLIFLWVLRAKLLAIHSQEKSQTSFFRSVVNLEQICLGINDKGIKNPALKLSDEGDNDYFFNVILNDKDIPNIKSSKKACKRMLFAYQYFSDRLDEQYQHLNSIDDQDTCISNFTKTFLDKFKILYMETTELEEAFVIFETLNARGCELETADLLKNFIFSKSPDVSAAEKKWNTMLSNLASTETSKSIDATKYIRHFWNSHHQCTREKDLYRSISREVINTQESINLLDDLVKMSSYYHFMTYPSEETKFASEELVDTLKSLDIINARTFYPIVISLIEKNYTESDITKVLKSIEAYMFRNSTIMKLTANRAEIFFSKVANKIARSEYSSVDQICLDIQDQMSSDDKFSQAFSTWSNKSKPVIQYIFRKINRYLDKNYELDLDRTKIHIEHVMPQSAENWNISDKNHAKYLWRLGNLTLLSGRLNKKSSNLPFEKKRANLAKSKIELNKYFLSCKKWGPAEIETRQKELAKIAVEVWR